MTPVLTVQTVAYVSMLEQVTAEQITIVSPEVKSMITPNYGGSAMSNYIRLDDFPRPPIFLETLKDAIRYVAFRCSFTFTHV